MSNLNARLTMRRIKHASPDSPIALFKCSEPGTVRSVFARTIMTQREIKTDFGKHSYLGSFHKDSDLRNVRDIIDAHIEDIGWGLGCA